MMVRIEEREKKKHKNQLEPNFNSIFMIDDDPLTNFMNMKLLTHMGAEDIAKIYTFDNGIEALNAIDQLSSSGKKKPELCILLDLQMLGIDGFEFLERLKKKKLNLKLRIYIVSGSLPVKRLQQLKSYSIAGFFLKPLTKGNAREILMPLNPIYFNEE